MMREHRMWHTIPEFVYSYRNTYLNMNKFFPVGVVTLYFVVNIFYLANRFFERKVKCKLNTVCILFKF